ncbi:MAG: SIR2 family protein, partial [Promethearchaeota archaeon]
MTDNLPDRDSPPHLPPELIAHLNRGDCVLFVGDALDGEGSQSARLAAALVNACGAHALCPVPSCQSGRACIQPHACAVPLARAAQLYEGATNRQALVDFVRRHVEDKYPSRPVQPVYRALAELPVQVIITTAYDDRLEAALEKAGRRYRSVVRDTDVPLSDPNYMQIIRLYGTASQPDSLVLTEDDAVDLFARLSPVLKISLQGRLAEKTLLFVGYGLQDRHFLDLYHETTAPIARYQRLAYAVQPVPDPLLVNRWHGKITLIDAEPLPFLIQLTKSVRIHEEEKIRAALPKEPYKFLDYYTREDAAIFFGRDLEADLLLSTILAHKLTVFYGRSGTGKTSLLLARVAPALEEAGYRVAYVRMLGDPASEVKAAVRGVPASQLAYADQGRCLHAVLVDAQPLIERLVVVLDQFEEFFVRQHEDVRYAFAQELADCLRPTSNESALDLRLVLSLRDDYLGALDELSAVLSHDVFAHRRRLENLTREESLLAILKPAEAFGLPIEEPLCELLVDDLEDHGLEPANLQIVLYRLYRDAVEEGFWFEAYRRGPGLTQTRYRALGGTRKILTGYLDDVLDELPLEEQRQQAHAILKSMVTAQRTKIAVSGQEIARSDLVAGVGLTEAELDGLLAYLLEKRVVRKFGDEDRYELTHEVLVEKVWAWFGTEELRVLDMRDMLRREMSSYRKFGYLLGKEKLELLDPCRDALVLNTSELEALLQSALAAGHEAAYWFERAREGGVVVDNIALEGIKSGNFRARVAAVNVLGQLGDRF